MGIILQLVYGFAEVTIPEGNDISILLNNGVGIVSKRGTKMEL